MNQRKWAERRFSVDVETVAGRIADEQRQSGEIPWHRDEKTDPWDHVEAVMGLATGGYVAEAERGLAWLAERQLSDGSWYSAYKNGVPTDRTRETHMAAYFAVGLFHLYLITGDEAVLRRFWPAAERAVDFARRHQQEGGEVFWAVSPAGEVDRMALLTGASSIYMSLKCAVALADVMDAPRPEWRTALEKLGDAIRDRPHLFNMTKSRYAMDWFYPILCGAVTGDAAQRRIGRYWKKFVIEGQGVRCVSDRPWVTVAETCEFCIALAAMGNQVLARIVFEWICGRTYPDGGYWCGFTFPDMVIWPEDRLTWTNGVVLMAADAVYGLTPAHRLFAHDFEPSRTA